MEPSFKKKIIRNPHGTPGVKQANRRKSKGKTSVWFGVYWENRKNRRKHWRSQIRIPGTKKFKFLGLFFDEKEAAIAYINAGKKYYNDPNFRLQDQQRLGLCPG